MSKIISCCKSLLMCSMKIFFISVLLSQAGCSSANISEVSSGADPNSRYELTPYLSKEFEYVEDSLFSNGKLSVSVDYPSENDTSNFSSIVLLDKKGNYLGGLTSQGGIYIDALYINDGFDTLTIMGIYPGMKASDAITILKESAFVFSHIYDVDTNETEGTCQSVTYKLNGVCNIILKINSNEEVNPYGSIDESDIHMDGIIGRVEAVCKVPSNYKEIGEGVGDPSNYAENLILEINDECVGLTDFISDDSVDVAGENIYGTYIFGANVITATLRPGRGGYPYLTKVCIEGICPYSVYGIYWGMEKDSVVAHLAELEAVLQEEYDDTLIYDIDSGKSLEIGFDENKVNFIGCVENPEQAYEPVW